MLSECARGYTITRKKHRYWVTYKSTTFRGLSTGEHGSKAADVQIGLVRSLVRYLDIDLDCAKKHLPILRS